MFDEKITSFAQLPLQDSDRKKTDILCTIVGAVFALTMFILAIVFMSHDNYQKSNYPTDSDYQPCSYGVNKNYPFVYLPNINDINVRVCLSRCPNAGDFQLSCRANSKVPSCAIPNIYSASVNFDRLGGFCSPNDEVAQEKLIKTTNLDQKWIFLDTFDSILLSLLFAFVIGLIWVFLVQFLPRAITLAVTVLAILVLAAFGIIILLDSSSGIDTVWKLSIGIVLLILSMLFLFFVCCYNKRNKLIVVFIDWGTRYLKQYIQHILFTFVFIFFTGGLICLCLFQHLAYLSHSQPSSQQGDIFLKLHLNTPLFVLNIVQLIWGLQFLKDSYNFVLSGLAVQWYCQKEVTTCMTFTRLLTNHFGSVVGGAFLNAFFNLIDFMFESLRCYPGGACSACASTCDCMLSCCANIFDLVRTDVYSYINLTGIAYCNAARNCEYLITDSALFVGSQSLLYFYRISAYCFTIGITVLLVYFHEKAVLDGEINLISIVLVTFLSYCILNFFVDLHPNIAEGIQISYLLQCKFGDKRRPNDPYDFKSEIRTLQKSYLDGVLC